MDPKQMAEIVGTTVRGMIDEQAQIQARINKVQEGVNDNIESQVTALVGYVTELSEALGQLIDRVNTPAEQVVMTPEQIEEQAAAYRGSIIMEAARLGVTGGELARAKKVIADG